MMHVILVGGDKTVYFLTRQLIKDKHHVTVINRDKANCNELCRQTTATVVHGDGSHKRVLEESGARQADVLLALTPNDQDNLVSCQLAKRVFNVPRTVALVNDPDNEQVFRQLGVDQALSKTRILSSVIEQQTEFDEITEVMPLANGKITISDVRLDADSPVVGKKLSDLGLTPSTLVTSIIRDEQVIVPHGNSQLQSGDHLLVLFMPENFDRDIKLLTGSKD